MNRNMRKMYTEEEIAKLGGTKLYKHHFSDEDRDFSLIIISSNSSDEVGTLSLDKMLNGLVTILDFFDNLTYNGRCEIVGIDDKLYIFDTSDTSYEEISLSKTYVITEHTVTPL